MTATLAVAVKGPGRIVCLLIPLLLFLAAGCASSPVERAAGRSGDETGRSAHEQEGAVVTSTAIAGEQTGATVGVSSSPESSETSEADTFTSEALEARSTEAPFVAAPEGRGGRGYGADGILAVRYGIHEGYERVVVDLGTGSEPAAGVPEWSLESPTGDGLLRVRFPSVNSTGVSDGRFKGPLLEDFHVVRAPEGGMFVDILSHGAFSYRVMELGDPARLIVDFKPAGMPPEIPGPVEGGNTVLTEPRTGARISGPLTVSGYSRNFEAANTIFLEDARGRVLVREVVHGNDWSATWGYFEATIELPLFFGRGTLKVGAESARDGSFEGVEIPVRGG